MSYKVSIVKNPPSYDSLPVAKVVTYPLEQRDYRPYAQNILCVSEDFLHLRMWAFEVNPSMASRLECVLYLFKDDPGVALAVVAVPCSDTGADMLGCCLLKDGQELPVSKEIEGQLQKITVHPHNGEDLQGVYWGYTIDIPRGLLVNWAGATLLEKADHFPGNFYKICEEEPGVHLGCFEPADFGANPYLLNSMSDFEVVGY